MPAHQSETADRAVHPLLPVLLAAADGLFPAADGGVTVLPALARGHAAVVSFTGHAVVATTLSAAEVSRLRPDGFGGATRPDVLLGLAGTLGAVGTIDATLVARGRGGGSAVLAEVALAGHPLAAHPRVRHALSLRDDVRVFAGEEALVTLAAGLAGRAELSIELLPGAGAGAGRRTLAEARRLVPGGEPVFAAVAPGNARSLRAFLAAGFVPVASETVIVPAGPRRVAP